MSNALPAGSVIGILGGGQLGRMLSVAASRLGYRCHIYDPAAGGSPAGQVAYASTTGAFDDAVLLRQFAQTCDVITYEFENIPAETVGILSEEAPVRPGLRPLEVSQDRLAEKDFLTGIGLSTAPYAAVNTLADLEAALTRFGTPAILKTRRMGYDGKGQVRINAKSDAPAAFEAMQGAAAILEGFVDFSSEVSVIAGRGLNGDVVCYDPGENTHVDGILRQTKVPAALPARLRTDAVILAGRILNALEYIGVLGVELFVTPGGLIVNEIAPRVHNSGHWTQNGCAVDQFEQHIRAITGWPLGDGARVANVTMENLIGDDIDTLPELRQASDVAIHLYGKAEARPGRKMGHINRVFAKDS